MAWIAALAVLSSVAILWGEHYTPWKRLLGRELHRVEAYILGVAAMIAPLIVLWAIWAHNPPAGNGYVWAAGTLLADVCASGMTVIGLYLVDGRANAEQRAAAAETAESFWKGE